MIKIFLDDSLHHTYNYVDQPHTYFCHYVTNPWPLSISYQFCLGGNATFCNKIVFLFTIIYSLRAKMEATKENLTHKIFTIVV